MDISALFTRLKNANFLRRTTKTIRRIERFEKAFENFGEADFAAKTAEFKRRVGGGEGVPALIPEAFALVRTAARRLCGKAFEVCGQPVPWNMVHYDVQLRAGIALAKNSICEIATGEGKTLIATLPAYIYALFGRGCHIATVNEYLTRRDCQWMSPLYNLLGLTCDCVFAGQTNAEKKAAYAADITYGTAAEFGFDYLRDNSTTFSLEEKVQRGFFFCLVDEADSVLVDEARTPLIISGGDDDEQCNPYAEYIGRVRSLAEAQNRLCGKIANEVFDRLKIGAKLDSSDIEKLAQVRFGAPRNKVLKRILKSGVANVELEKKVTELSVNFGESEKLKLLEKLYYYVDEKTSTASLTKAGQRFLEPDNPDAFVVPDVEKLSDEIDSSRALSDVEKSRKKAEVAASLSAAVERLRIISQLLRAFSLYERDVDYIVRDGKVEIVDPNTGRVMEGRRWSDGLHQAVEAKEGLKIGAENITYATVSIQNYFKMYEKLSGMTGTAAELSEEFLRVYKTSVIEIPPNKPCVRIDNPDLVFLTRSEKFARIAETAKSVAASGRPVLVGTGSVEESEVLSKMLKIGGVKHSLLNAKNDAQEAALVARAGGAGTITVATNMAGRGTDIKLADGVNERGGLFIISSEHNYSRRIDRQLMGRCARQGDNGQTQFIVSLEDELFRKYADVAPFQNALKSRHRQGVPFVHPLFGRLVERTQDRLEGDYSAARREMLKFDNPANKQRNVAYAMRDEILSSDSIDGVYSKAVSDVCTRIAAEVLPSEDIEIDSRRIAEYAAHLGKILPLRDGEIVGGTKREVAESAARAAEKSFNAIFGAFDAETSLRIKKFVALRTFDRAWREHIARLESLRDAVFLRGYAQKDPYCEFEKEAYESFKNFFADFSDALFGNLCGFLAAVPTSGAETSNPSSKYRALTK